MPREPPATPNWGSPGIIPAALKMGLLEAGAAIVTYLRRPLISGADCVSNN